MFNQMSCMFIQMQEEPDEDSQCLSDDTDTEISTQVYIFRYVFSNCVVVVFACSCRFKLCVHPSGCVAVHRVQEV